MTPAEQKLVLIGLSFLLCSVTLYAIVLRMRLWYFTSFVRMLKDTISNGETNKRSSQSISFLTQLLITTITFLVGMIILVASGAI